MAATAITDRTNNEGAPLAATTTAEATTTDKASRVTGTVRWFSHKGFGFIDRHGGGDVYVHHSGIVGSGFRTLATGAVVQFSVRQTRRGPEAVDVVVLDDPARRSDECADQCGGCGGAEHHHHEWRA